MKNNAVRFWTNRRERANGPPIFTSYPEEEEPDEINYKDIIKAVATVALCLFVTVAIVISSVNVSSKIISNIIVYSILSYYLQKGREQQKEKPEIQELGLSQPDKPKRDV